jgi:hypothetical protein
MSGMLHDWQTSPMTEEQVNHVGLNTPYKWTPQ